MGTNLGAFKTRMYNVPRISSCVQDNEKLPPAHRTWRALRRHRTSWVPEAPEPARHGLLRGRGDNRISSSSLLLSTHTQQQLRHTRLVTLVIAISLLVS